MRFGSSSPTKEIPRPLQASSSSRRSRTRRSRPSRARHWKARASTLRAPRPPTRTCRRVRTGTFLSLGTSFGLSVLIWQHILGIQLHWMVLAMSVIILLAVGSDYNLLLVSRFKEEIHAGIKTGIIRSMAGTGAVVTSAGLVFAATMASFVASDLKVMGQVGTTIGLGLLFDTLIVRSFMMPSVAALLGRWFWWPTNVRSRPPPAAWPVASGRDPETGAKAEVSAP